MSGEGSPGNREVPLTSRPMEEGGSWGKHGFPQGSEADASDAHQGGTVVVSVGVVSVGGGGGVVVGTVVTGAT